jgi:DNA-binding MarR family transcriptional regulator
VATSSAPHATRSEIDQALAGYRRLVGLLSAARTPEFPDPHVTMAQMRVLMLLSALGETRMSDLAHQQGISLSTLSSLADRLVEAGLAQRRSDPRDRRGVLVSLTPAGATLIDHFQELGTDHLRLLLEQLDNADIATVNHALDVLVAAARRIAAEEHP